VIAVASYITKNEWDSVNHSPGQDAGAVLGNLSSFSSLGPRRNCSNPSCPAVQKPDVAAPGEMIMSSYAAGSATNDCWLAGGGECLDPDGQHIADLGTSQATPHVTGAVALLLAQNQNMTPCQVKASLSQARADSFTGTVPNNSWGFGKLAIDLAIGGSSVRGNVPGVVGLTLAAAKSAIAAAGMQLATITYAGSGTVPVGSVISQKPAPGTGCAGSVSLVVSGIAVPNVLGYTQGAASAAIAGAGLTAGTLAFTGSGTVPVGNVVSTNPAAGTYVGAGSAVNLTISGVAVPNVSGETQAAASAAITGASLTVGKLTPVASTTVPANSVMSTNPAAGTYVAPGSAVDLVVSGVTVPAVTGETKAVRKPPSREPA